MPDFKDVRKEKYLLLTTFTKDGKPKPTAVWGVPEGDKLLITSLSPSGTPQTGVGLGLPSLVKVVSSRYRSR